MDDDESRLLDITEFKRGIYDYGITMDTETKETLFSELDKDGSGAIDFDEFLQALRPPMNNAIKTLIIEAFQKLDKTGDGVITVQDLAGVFDVSQHEKCLSGEWTEEQCLREFLDSFDTPDNKDGQITEDEFINYYREVSASIDSDAYFEQMMRNAWGI